jgi:hypothetical protein
MRKVWRRNGDNEMRVGGKSDGIKFKKGAYDDLKIFTL